MHSAGKLVPARQGHKKGHCFFHFVHTVWYLQADQQLKTQDFLSL